jgi:transcriptional regulator with XRE-family HTH domain
MRDQLAKTKIEQLMRKLAAIILREIKGLSVRQAEAITGLHAGTISRLRRGLRGHLTLESLLSAAMEVGVPIEIDVSEPRTPAALSQPSTMTNRRARVHDQSKDPTLSKPAGRRPAET